jgi:hypothetical protein
MKPSPENHARQQTQRHLVLIAEVSLVLLFPVVLQGLLALGSAPVA